MGSIIVKSIVSDFRAQFSHFLRDFTLYTKLRLKLPPYNSGFHIIDVLVLHCPTCKAERPFRYKEKGIRLPTYGGGNPEALKGGIKTLKLDCTGCEESSYQWWWEVNVEGSWIRKIGQIPEWSIDIPADFEHDLAGDAEFYKKSLILMSQGYGLGACVYLRRIVENQINPLLELIKETRISEGSDEKSDEITSAMGSKDFASKIKIASDALPTSLIVNGENPIKLIYDQLSISIHSLSDDDAMDIALKVKAAFEYVIRELKRQLETKRAFIGGIKALRSGEHTT